MSRSTYIARTISRLTNPCFLGPAVLILIAYTRTLNLWSILSQVSLIILGLLLLPIGYVLFRMARMGTRAERLGDLVGFLKEHPRDVGTLGMICGLPCTLVLLYIDASSYLVATLTSLLACSLLIALFRNIYKVSYHLAGITCLAVMAAVTWNPLLATTLVIIPVVMWARAFLQEHTVGQMISGSLLAVIVCIAAIYGFGLL